MSSNKTKTYKLNKTFESSLFPIEQELLKLNQSTKKSWNGIFGNIAAAFFSGVGTSLLFQDNCIPQLINELIEKNTLDKSKSIWINIALVFIIFILLFFIGLLLNKLVGNEKNPISKKKTACGRNELVEIFHKSIINNIVTGISFINKAEENNYSDKTDQMYIYESAYYYKLAMMEIEEIDLFTPEYNINNDELIRQIGIQTLLQTLAIFKDGVDKTMKHLPEGKEKKDMINIFDMLGTFEGKLNQEKKVLS